MAIVSLVLGLVFFALGAVPSIASQRLAVSVREVLPQADVRAELSAVPTWRILGGHADRLDLALGDLPADGFALQNVRVQAAPFDSQGPAEFLVQFAVAEAPLKQRIETEANQYVASLAANLGLPGASLDDLDVQIGAPDRPVQITGRLSALGGLIGMDLAIAGGLGFGDGALGLTDATVTINDQPQHLGFVPLVALPELPTGVRCQIRALRAVGAMVHVAMTVGVLDLNTIPAFLQSPRAGNEGESS